MRKAGKKARREKRMPSQRTVTLSKDALIKVSVESIKMEVKVNELVNAIITNTDWERSAPNLHSLILEERNRRKEESNAL